MMPEQDPPPRLPPSELAPDRDGPSLTTLVVDDDPTSREMLAKVLEHAGHTALTADSAEQALQLFEQYAPDMVLMDIMLPGMDGCEAMRIMKRSRGNGWLPVILISVMDTPEEVLSGLRAGADDYLTKPVRVDHVLAKLRNTTRTLLLQQKLESSARFARAVMDHVQAPLLCCDEQGLIQSANRAAEQTFGYAPSELDRLPIRQVFVDAAPSQWPGIRRSPEWLGTGRRKNGELFSLDAKQSSVEIEGRALSVLTLRDVTEELSEERRKLNDAARLLEYKQRHEAETALAHEMLDKLMRRGAFSADSLRFRTESATGFSGDVVAGVRAPSGELFVLLADATGHGLAAAISLVPALSILYAMVARGCTLSQIVLELNRKMHEMLPVGRFLAGALVRLDKARRQGEIWVAGVPAALLLSSRGEVMGRFESEHLAFGILADAPDIGTTTTFHWSDPSQLVLVSDGVTEAENVEGELFGEAGLLEALRGAGEMEPLDAVSLALRQHLGGLAAGDDASIALLDLK